MSAQLEMKTFTRSVRPQGWYFSYLTIQFEIGLLIIP